MGNNHGSRFSDGLLLGMIIGGALVFLIGTHKGKKLLKAITEEGFEGLGDIAKEWENEAKKETKTQLKRVEEKIEDIGESIEVETNGNGHNEGKPHKRFFKKSPAKN
ncbi:MAG: YtxH domain-containing protein [Candidatus Levybacteria bacterium]|nr:YtxH domain-containing protein [Candidatus Levybacteria bacterium]